MKKLEKEIIKLRRSDCEQMAMIFKSLADVCLKLSKRQKSEENKQLECVEVEIKTKKAVAESIELIACGVSFETAVSLIMDKYKLKYFDGSDYCKRTIKGNWNCAVANMVSLQFKKYYMKGISPNIKAQIRRIRKSGQSFRKIAIIFGISKDAVMRICKTDK